MHFVWCIIWTMGKRKITNRVNVGGVLIGGGAPVVVQSMCCAPAEDAAANFSQIKSLHDAGCEIVRMTVPSENGLKAFKEVCAQSPIPVVADIHFRADLAIKSILAGASKIRINPGNLGGLEKTDEIIKTAHEHKVPIRIGINAGSLDEKLKARQDMSLAEKLVASASEYVDYFYARDFTDIVVSLKAHDVITCIEANRLMAKTKPEIPLHLGITEAGTKTQGVIKSAAGLGILLEEGIGDTIRISLTDDPVEEVKACWQLLSALDLRRQYPEIISCPTCGRTKVDLIKIAKEIEDKISNIKAPIKVAVMGCIVNGPGEAEGADIGVACSAGGGAIFKDGQVIRKVKEDEIIPTLLEEIKNLTK